MGRRKLQTIVTVIAVWIVALAIALAIGCRWLWSLAERFQ
jgi:hypothetical protein